MKAIGTAFRNFLYLLGRLSTTSSGSGWSKEEAIKKWAEYVHDANGNLRTKYRVRAARS